MYILDQPEEGSGEDILQRKPFAERVAESIAGSSFSASLVVGIYGAWGEGKSSLLNYMCAAIDDLNLTRTGVNRILRITFNPWLFSDERALVESFFASFRDGIREDALTEGIRPGLPKREVGPLLEKYGRLFSSISVGGIKPMGIVSELGKALSTVSLERLKNEIAKVLLDRQQRLVVVIDDIDRMNEGEIQSIFKLVRLAADFPYVTYVLAFDPAIVSAAIGRQFSDKGDITGRSFLEKIVQVPLSIPKATRAGLTRVFDSHLTRILASLNLNFSEEDWREFSTRYNLGIAPAVTTARQIKQLANALLFAIPLSLGETNTIDVMTLEAIRLFYPNIYALMRSNAEFFIGYKWQELREDEEADRSNARTEIERAMKPFEVANSSIRWLLCRVFPYVAKTFKEQADRVEEDNDLLRDRRIASSAYYDRYFLYAVPSADLADQEVLKLIEVSRAADYLQIDLILRTLSGEGGGDSLASKLPRLASSVARRDIFPLALALSKSGGRFRTSEGLDRAFAPRTLMGQFVADITFDYAAGPGNADAYKEIASVAEPLEFGCEIALSMADNRSGPIEGQKQMFRELASRIADRDAEQPILASEDSHTLWFLDIWLRWGDKAKFRASIDQQLEEDPCRAVRLIRKLIPKFSRPDRSASNYLPLEREAYNRLINYVDADSLRTALKRCCPNLDEIGNSQPGTTEWVARQFIDMRNMVAAQEQSNTLSLEPPL